ncbi:hypothetical protein NE237_001984 [Protea cynaroides]|uniref:Uncharacterized protein n=1 Tax=Protea cynaroides TaxID=273540 RepID=A0A9Q0KU45_9MAGN|nr:hypothetical protein NE237_001984 [Protea cynaroides]
MVDEDCISWIDIVHTAYYTFLKDIPDGRSVSFSVRAEMPNGGYYEVKSNADVLALVKIFKEQGRAMLLEVYGVNVGDATLDRYTINGYDSSMIGRPPPSRRQSRKTVGVPALVVFSNSSEMMMEGM